MSEFFGIRAKLYHYVLENSSVGSRHKVIKVRVTYGHWRIGTFHYVNTGISREMQNNGQ
ncbi:hypothetical protein RhiirC2_727898 [Rhizophagus irregularis]|uniref:Uncharacterized protein n=1 Tax=Rhizophagus irregularis TaxID=588596 RepID=A0A2N1NZ37_9GLOM|nr:hypothetical protein RhiirC2_727898 [Rhizophagus irregularis]